MARAPLSRIRAFLWINARIGGSAADPEAESVCRMMRCLHVVAGQVLGTNRRNQELITRYNPRSLFQVVDHKVKTKEALSALGVPVVDTLAVYHFQYDIRRFAGESRGWREFVLKPAQGAGGGRVVLVSEQEARVLVTSHVSKVWARDLHSHSSAI